MRKLWMYNNEGLEVKPSAHLKILGSGGAFDIEEGNSSALFRIKDKLILIDCGPSIYPELRKLGVERKIDLIIITHTHEDHIGSLSSLIYDNWYKKWPDTNRLSIMCHDSVAPLLKKYLVDVCRSDEDMFKIITNTSSKLYGECDGIHLIDTSLFHYYDMPNSGIVFELEKGFIIWSGDINKPILGDIINNQDRNLWNRILEEKENTYIFHDAQPNPLASIAHCLHKRLSPWEEVFNIHYYHHSKEAGEKMGANRSLSCIEDKNFLFLNSKSLKHLPKE